MLGWALKKGFQGATGGSDAPAGAEDTTQFEAPDTPAPIFAARAIKYAIFGTPAPPTSPERGRVTSTTEAPDARPRNQSPVKQPSGILLTPGTGTARRKRVSFGHDVKADTNSDTSHLATKASGAGQRKKTNLQQALENARARKENSRTTSVPEAQARGKPAMEAKATALDPVVTSADEETDGEWEDDVCNHDVTVDLNDPKSQSGKFWKSTYNKYHTDAVAEMERLIKYKHLAKLYAEKKDAEAVDLNERLKEEKEKVIQMEKKITDMAAQMADKRKRGVDTDSASLMKHLADKTALAVKYRDRVRELEAFLDDSESGKSHCRRINTSPRTEKTLLDVNRELRRARNELKEMNSLREQVERLKSALQSAEQRATKLEEENKRLTPDASQQSLVEKLEKQVRDLKNESRRKDEELMKLRNDYNVLKLNAKTTRSQAMQVLQEKNDKVSGLEKEIQDLKAKDTAKSRPKSLDASIGTNRATRNLMAGIESLSKPSVQEKKDSQQYHKRSISADDITLDLSQHRLLEGNTGQNLSTIPKEAWPSLRQSSIDWTSLSALDENTLKRDRKERSEARRRSKEMTTDEFDLDALKSPRESATPKVTERSSRPTRISSVLSDRVNDASSKAPHLKASNRESASTRATSRGNQDLMHGTLHKMATNRTTSKSYSSRTLTSENETPDIDLIQDRFARLGGPDMNGTLFTANASRCTLPADRQAAAKARLEKKRRERQTAGKRGSDEENVRPY